MPGEPERIPKSLVRHAHVVEARDVVGIHPEQRLRDFLHAPGVAFGADRVQGVDLRGRNIADDNLFGVQRQSVAGTQSQYLLGDLDIALGFARRLFVASQSRQRAGAPSARLCI